MTERAKWMIAVAASALTAGAALADAPFGSAALAGTDRPLRLAQESADDLFLPTDEAVEESPADAVAAPLEANEPIVEQPADEALEAESVDDLFEADEPQAGPAEAPKQREVRVSGFVQNELGYVYTDPDHFSKFKTLAKLRLNGNLSSRVRWQVGGHLQFDPVFEFENFYPDRVEDDQKLDGYVDETFLDIDADQWEFRLGRQHIIWGEMVGLFFADVVSALDLREFVLPDFDIIRIPQWAARAEYFAGDYHADVIFLPYVTMNDAGEFGAEFNPLPTALQTVFLEDKDPNDPGEDFGFGLRGSVLRNGWDVSLFYYTSPDRQAAIRRQIQLAPLPTLLLDPVHERIHQVGSTLAKEFGAFVVKAEAVETKDRLMSVTRPTDLDGLVATDELRYVVGLDWAGEGGHNANLQFFQTWFQDHDSTMLVDELESGLSVLLTTTSLHPKVTPELLWIRSLNREEWLLEAKVTWDFARNWRGVLGADIFEGPPTALLGQFDQTDRVYYELRFSF